MDLVSRAEFVECNRYAKNDSRNDYCLALRRGAIHRALLAL